MDALAQIRERAENDLKAFARLVNPHRVYGSIHDEVFDMWQADDHSDNSLVLLPRDHQKSHCAAVKAAWDVVRDPAVTVLYISGTADLAEKQLGAIKNILDSKIVRRYWPDLIKKEEGKREKWTTMEIAVDHPTRKKEGVRDMTIKAAGLTTNITGFHANIIYLDDLVIPNNAYTEEGRRKVRDLYSYLASVETTGAETIVVGTRYHPDDLYQTLITMMVEVYENKELVRQEPMYKVMQRVVEEEGEFLWPRTKRSDGKMFGFDENELAKKRAKYVDKTRYYAQYYNDPNRGGEGGIDRSKFQYYSKKNIVQEDDGHWYYRDRKLSLGVSLDFAFSLKRQSDYTAIVVVGMDEDKNIYVLDIERFKSNRVKDYYQRVKKLHLKWEFRKMRAECTVAQVVIVNELRQYAHNDSLHLKIEDYYPSMRQGSKEERTRNILGPRYENLSIYHYRGGWCQILEEELELQYPDNDDVKDTLASAVDFAVPPKRTRSRSERQGNVLYHSRFGGVRYA